MGTNLTKQKSEHENYEILMKEIEENTNKDIFCSWIGRIGIIKMSIDDQSTDSRNSCPTFNGYFYVFPYNHKMHIESKNKTTQTNVSLRKNKIRNITIPAFKFYYKAILYISKQYSNAMKKDKTQRIESWEKFLHIV